MSNLENVISKLEILIKVYKESKWRVDYTGDELYPIFRDALALIKEQDKTINDLTDTIRQLNQHIKDLSEYMTPYGKVKDVKAYAELLKEQDKRYAMMVVDWLRDMAHNNYLDSSHMTFWDAILDIRERAQTGLENYFSDYDSDTKRQEGR